MWEGYISQKKVELGAIDRGWGAQVGERFHDGSSMTGSVGGHGPEGCERWVHQVLYFCKIWWFLLISMTFASVYFKQKAVTLWVVIPSLKPT